MKIAGIKSPGKVIYAQDYGCWGGFQLSGVMNVREKQRQQTRLSKNINENRGYKESQHA